eukprot:RCo008996
MEAVSSDGETALHRAAWRGPEMTAQLLQARASVDAVDHSGNTPLHTAAFFGEEEVAELLLRALASPLAVNRVGLTPAQLAEQNEHSILAEHLLEAEQQKATATEVLSEGPDFKGLPCAGRQSEEEGEVC